MFKDAKMRGDREKWVEKSLSKRPSKVQNGMWNFVLWRGIDFWRLSTMLLGSSISSFNQKIPKVHLQLFNHDVAIQILHEFMGSSITASTSSEETTVAKEETIAAPVRSDFYVATFITRHRAEECEKGAVINLKCAMIYFHRFSLQLWIN